jgi:hypothetical protein
MSRYNSDVMPGKDQSQYWASAVGSNVTLATTNQLSCRRVVVGAIVGPLTLVNCDGVETTFTAGQITALGGVLDGQWSAIRATSSAGTASTSYQLLVIR